MIHAKVPIKLIDFIDKFEERDLSESTANQVDLLALANNIVANGLLHPIVLRKKADGGYYVIAGRRRILAYNMIERSNPSGAYLEIDASIREDTVSDINSNDIMATLSENKYRKNIDEMRFANTFFVAIAFKNMTEDDIIVLEREELEDIGKAEFLMWLFLGTSIPPSKVLRAKVDSINEKFKSTDAKILIAVESVVRELGYSRSGITKKIKIVQFDESLLRILRTGNISYNKALNFLSLSKKDKKKYSDFIKEALLTINEGKDISELVDIYLSGSKIAILDRKNVTLVKKMLSKIEKKLNSLSSASEKFKIIKGILENVEKDLS